MFIIYIFEIIFLIIVIIVILHNHKKEVKLDGLLGEVKLKWSNMFSLNYLCGIVRLILLLFSIGFILYWIIVNPNLHYGHILIIAVISNIGSYMKWQVKIGENGVIVRLKFFAWDTIKGWKVDYKKNKVILDIEGEGICNIRILSRYRRKFNNILTNVRIQNRFE